MLSLEQAKQLTNNSNRKNDALLIKNNFDMFLQHRANDQALVDHLLLRSDAWWINIPAADAASGHINDIAACANMRNRKILSTLNSGW